MSAETMPRLGPSIIRRQGLEDWLGRFTSVPVRFLVAPNGFGKTMALSGYLRHMARNGRYCGIPAGSDAQAIWGCIARALEVGKHLNSHAERLQALATRAPIELALDCAQVPDQTGIEAMLSLIEDAPEDVSLLIACRSRAAFQVGRFISEGRAVLCDTERLAFDAAEIRHLAETLGVPFTHADVLRMLEVTDGWPQVVSGALRKAGEDNLPLAQAFEHWRVRYGHLFNEFLVAGLKNVSEREADSVLKLMSGSHLDDRTQMQALEEQGLFVIHTSEGYRPLRALSRSRVYDRYGRRVEAVSPMEVRLFGWFLAEIDQQPIDWVRRRDRQVFKYVALQPGGRVSRAELSQVFWPGAERHLVAQSLRTVCSNIRKAIAHIVGFKEVESYFHAGDEISIDLDNVVVDVNRFVTHVNDADEQYERGELRAAYAHYRNAARVYRGDLLIGDAHEQWVGSLDSLLKQRQVIVLERIANIVSTLDDQSITAVEPDLRRASAS